MCLRLRSLRVANAEQRSSFYAVPAACAEEASTSGQQLPWTARRNTDAMIVHEGVQYRLSDVPYDGNCMFSAATAACGHGDGAGDAHALRRVVAALVGSQPPGSAATSGRVQIAMINHMPVDVSTPAAWAAHVGKDGVWGTVAELPVLAEALDCSVHVYEATTSPSAPTQPSLRLRACAGLESSVRPPVRLLNVGNVHFRPLVPVVRNAGEP